MTRRPAFILILAAILLTAFSAALSRRDSSDWRANRSRRLFPFPQHNIAAVTLTHPDGRKIVMEHPAGQDWQLRVSPELTDSLSQEAVDGISALATLAWREPLRDGKPPAPDQAITLEAVSFTGQKLLLAFGDAAGPQRALAIDNDNSTVYGVSRDLLGFLDWPQSRFRNMLLAAAPPSARIKRVEVAPPGRDPGLTLILEKDGDSWNMTKPVAWPADESRLDILFQWLDRLPAATIEAEQAADAEWFGFGPDSAYVEAVYDRDDGKPLVRRVEFGKATDAGGIYARDTGRNPIFSVPAHVLEEISLDAASAHPEPWRNFYRRRAINVVGENMPKSVVVERLLPNPQKLVLEQTADGWRGTLETDGVARSFPVDAPLAEEQMRPLTALLTGLSSLRVKNFLAESEPGPDTLKWTAFPAWRFSAKLPDGKQTPALTLYAADADGNLPPGAPFARGKAGPADMNSQSRTAGIAFSLVDRKAVLEMHAELAYLLCLPPYRYQSSAIAEIDHRMLRRVELATPEGTTIYTRDPSGVNEQWWRTEGDHPEPLMDDNNLFVGALVGLSRLRTPGYVAEETRDVKEFGLDQPMISIIVYVSEGKPGTEKEESRAFSLDIGATADAETGARYARLNGGGPVFLVPGSVAETFETDFR